MTEALEKLILTARAMNVSDIHMTVGVPLLFRINGELTEALRQPTPQETEEMLLELLSDEQKDRLRHGYDIDFALETKDGNRQRVNVFRQQNAPAATIRLLNSHIPNLEELCLPEKLYELVKEPRGLILVTGPTGSGKSTTLAALLEYINCRYARHVITIEDPIEYTYSRKKSLIHQREVGRDVVSFASALRSALREDPDVILVGEMRDYETISAALTAAETGHLVMATLHTTGAAQTMDRIIDVCPAGSQNQVRSQLAGVLKGVVTQCLLKRADGMGRIAATELLVGTDAVSNLIRESKTHQLPSIMQAGSADGMHTLNMDLYRLVRSRVITKETALQNSNDRKDFTQYL